MSPVGSTNPDSFGLVPQEALTVGASGYYEHRETGQILDRHKCLVWYGPENLAVDLTFIDGRLHRASCYTPEGAIASEIFLGTGIINRYYPDGQIWERRYYKRGVYIKRELYKNGALETIEEDINIGNSIPNDGLEVFMGKCSRARKAVFNARNGRVLGGILLSVTVGWAASKLLESVSKGDQSSSPTAQQTDSNVQQDSVSPESIPSDVGAVSSSGVPSSTSPPPGYYRDYQTDEIIPMNPGFAGYYRSASGEVIPIRKPGTAILPTSDPIAVGDMYLNPDTGQMAPITIVWPIQ